MKRLAIILAAWCVLAGFCSAQTFPGDWAGYIEATADAPAGSLTDFVYIIQIDSSNADFWANVRSDGGDIRVTIDGTQVPVDPMTDIAVWNYAGESAVIACKRSGAASTAPVIRVYAGCPSATLPAANSTYGQDNAYPSHFFGFWPMGGGADRTSNNNDMTANGGVTVGGVSGPINGSLATAFDGTDDYFHANTTALTTQPISQVASAYRAATGATHIPLSAGDTATDVNYSELRLQTDQVSSTDRGSAFTGATGGTTLSASTWYRPAALHASASSRRAMLAGAQQATNSTAVTLSGFDQLRIGSGVRGSAPTGLMNGRLAFVSLHSADLSDNWLLYDAAMLADPDQSDFYNGWTANFSSGGSPKISPALLNSVIQ